MLTIWKHELNSALLGNGATSVFLPEDARFIHIDVEPSNPADYKTPRVWSIHDTDIPKSMWVHHRLRVYGTGHPIESAMDWYIGSVVVGGFAWHVFKILN